MRLIDRIFQYLSHRNLNAYTFERECGIANGYLNKQKKGKGTIGSEILEKISVKYKDVSLSWLITGKGKMLNTDSYLHEAAIPSLSEAPTEYGTTDATIRNLREKINILENALADKEKIIRLLEKKS